MAIDREPIKVFMSYAHEDERFKDELIKHLSILKRDGIISMWHDRMISPGGDWKGEIDQNLEAADIVLLLVSASFLASDYCCDVELKRALERHGQGLAVVIPVILRPVDWMRAPFSKLLALPRDAKPVTEWPSEDAAFADIAKGIRSVVEAKEPSREVMTQSSSCLSPVSRSSGSAAREKRWMDCAYCDGKGAVVVDRLWARSHLIKDEQAHCPVCRGYGQIYSALWSQPDCRRCQGSGKLVSRMYDRLTFPQQLTTITVCDVCGGTGKRPFLEEQ